MSFLDNTEKFRDLYRKEQISPTYSGKLHFWFTTLSCLCVIIFSISHVHDIQNSEYWVIPITFIYANLIEYVGHKGPMHHRRKMLEKVFKRHTLEHHQFFTHEVMECRDTKDFKMILFPPILLIFFFFGFSVPATILIYVLWSANAAWLFMATLIAYYLNYEWLHLSYHLPKNHWIARLPIVKKFRLLHLHHHNPMWMQKYNFNISYPIFDYIFGTVKK